MLSKIYRCLRRPVLLALTGVVLTACGSLKRVDTLVSPYRYDVIQGNFVSREQAQALQPGMSRLQVRDILGTPLLVSVFHGDRWDYVFTIRRGGLEPQQFRMTVYFKGEVLDRFEGDTLPSESEFVSHLNPSPRTDKVPVLEATQEQLAKYPAAKASDPRSAASGPSNAPAMANYPPLEPPAR